MTNSDRPTIIEKYANRRLYNNGTYSFVTLDELAAMVKRARNFRLRRKDRRRHHPIGACAHRLRTGKPPRRTIAIVATVKGHQVAGQLAASFHFRCRLLAPFRHARLS